MPSTKSKVILSGSFLFLSRSGTRRDLHSFPTRRSSDLPDNRVQGFLGPGHVCTVMGCGEYEPIVRRYRVTMGRSEEHTSELQSHSDLVCRLLLEKKKNRRRRCRPRPPAAVGGAR